MFRAEAVGTGVALLGMVGADGYLTDGALDAIGWTDCLPACLTRIEMVGSERIATDFAVAVVVAAQRIAARCAVGCMICAEHVTARSTLRGISFADAVVARSACHEMRVSEVIAADVAR